MTPEYIVTGRINGTTKLGSPFCTLKLRNLEEELSVAVWDVAPGEDPQMGHIVTFVIINNGDGRHTARKTDMVLHGMAEASHPLYNLIPRPVERDKWDHTIHTLTQMCGDSILCNLITEAADKLYQPYSMYPAATSIHHAFPGGLLNHTYQMLHMLEGIAPTLPYQTRIDYCVLGILFHDYGKTMTYKKSGEKNAQDFLLGHIYISAYSLHREMEKRNIDSHDIERVIHIILAHHGIKEYGSPVVPCTQEAILVHMLDNLSAKTDTIDSSADMEYVNTLGTTVVK